MTTTESQRLCDTEIFIVQEDTRRRLIGKIGELLESVIPDYPSDLKSLAYSNNCPLSDSPYCLAVVADSISDLIKKLNHAAQRLKDAKVNKIKDRSGVYFFAEQLGRRGDLAYLFPGQGAQYSGMLMDLSLIFPEVRTCFDLLDRVYAEENWDFLPSQVLFSPQTATFNKPSGSDRDLWGILFAMGSVFTANLALFRLLNRFAIKPQSIVGHSSGEFSALVAAGALELSEGGEVVKFGRDLIEIYRALDKPDSRSKATSIF